MKNLKYISLLALLVLVSFSCEDVIDIDADFQEAELVVDAWLTQSSEVQTLNLTLSQDYFDSTPSESIRDAIVTLTNETQGRTFDFEHLNSSVYSWMPQAGDKLGEVGDEFTLNVSYNDYNYFATTTLAPVATVDSIGYEFREDDIRGPDGIYAQFYARDLVGIGNTYWIKTYKNGQFLNKPSEMNLCYDGTFDAGSGTDGIVFIPPIREFINPVPDELEDGEEEQAPYAIGDNIRVEVHSISNEAHRFLTIALEQMTNGDNGIFALPVANSPSNIQAVEADAPAALGFFNIAAVSALEVVVQ
ncbi:MAG: DUF4249 domain-containing protein [Bacteroidota bacterium]